MLRNGFGGIVIGAASEETVPAIANVVAGNIVCRTPTTAFASARMRCAA